MSTKERFSRSPEQSPRNCPERIIIFMGPPTSGKTSQAKQLVNNLEKGWGKLVLLKGRDVAMSAVGEDKIKECEKNRLLVEDTLFCEKLKEQLKNIKEETLILENIPRTEEQATILVEWAKENDIKLQLINLQLTEEKMQERAKQRQFCPECNTTYHPQLRPSVNEGFCNDHPHTHLQTRTGDVRQTLANGFSRYTEMIESVIPVLEDGNCLVLEINATGTVDKVFSLYYGTFVVKN